MFTVECRYSPKQDWETIVSFTSNNDAYKYAKKHNTEGGCILRVVEKENCSLGFKIYWSNNRTNCPIGISFKYHSEADTFAYNKGYWNGGILYVVEQQCEGAVT